MVVVVVLGGYYRILVRPYLLAYNTQLSKNQNAEVAAKGRAPDMPASVSVRERYGRGGERQRTRDAPKRWLCKQGMAWFLHATDFFRKKAHGMRDEI